MYALYNFCFQVAVTYSVLPRGTFASLNQYGHPNVEPKFLRTKFVEKK